VGYSLAAQMGTYQLVFEFWLKNRIIIIGEKYGLKIPAVKAEQLEEIIHI
jgi:hypothetical protein